MRWLLKKLFKRYRKEFDELYISELISEIPREVNDSVIAILANTKDRLDLWLRWQSYLIQRRMVSDTRRSDFYYGILIHISTLLSLINRQSNVKKQEEGKIEEKKIDEITKALEGVKTFSKYGKRDKSS